MAASCIPFYRNWRHESQNSGTITTTTLANRIIGQLPGLRAKADGRVVFPPLAVLDIAFERAYATELGADTAYSGRFHHNQLPAAYVTKVRRDAPVSVETIPCERAHAVVAARPGAVVDRGRLRLE